MGIQAILSLVSAGIVIPAILIYAGITDIRTRTVANKVCVLTALCGFPCFNIWNLFGLIPVSVILIIAVRTRGIGGGDIKLLAALSLPLGLTGMMVLLFCASFSMMMFYCVLKIVGIIKGKTTSKSFPFIPFIAFGYFINLFRSIFL